MISVTTAELNAWLAAFLWPLARILALVASAPILGNVDVPARVKIGLGVFITVVVAPALDPMPQVDPASGPGLLILAQQLLIGLGMGFAVRVVFHASEVAGEIAGLQMGLGFATLYDPSVPGQIPVIGQFLGIVVSLAFLAVDGHLVLISTLIDSFRTLPVAVAAPDASGLRALADWGGSVFIYSLALSLPLLAALLVANLALGILTRAAPQLNIFAVGFPLLILIGLLVLALSLPYITPILERLFEEAPRIMLELARRTR